MADNLMSEDGFFLRFSGPMGSSAFVLAAAVCNTLLFHFPLFGFACHGLDLSLFSGGLTLVTIVFVMTVGTGVLLHLLAFVSVRLLKPFCMLVAVGNSVAVYFLFTYNVFIDKSMMGNVWNTNLVESSEYLHPTLFVFLFVLGFLPCLFLFRLQILPKSRVHHGLRALAFFALILVWGYFASSTWLWLDKNSKRVGGRVLPWSYLVNAARYEVPRWWHSRAPDPLPPAHFVSEEKSVVVLVIGEAARADHFQLYGYERPTNPRLSQEQVIALKDTSACATYTTAALRCILSHDDASSALSKASEPLPSYLHRSGLDVIWRTRNWGEPAMEVDSFERPEDLDCVGSDCNYDEVLLTGLAQRIDDSKSKRVFVVLHQWGSHGPAYYTKYPSEFEVFKPVCQSVELSRCSSEELVNAYDNTLLYTDAFLASVIDLLKGLENTSTAMMYVSDHGESLGEYGLYLHGMPNALAPDAQKSVPFILWMSERFKQVHGVDTAALESQTSHCQRNIFHSIMGSFSMRSDAYDEAYDIFSQ